MNSAITKIHPEIAESSDAPMPQYSLRHCVTLLLEEYFKTLDGHPPVDLYNMVINEVEQPLLQSVISYTRGNQSRAAEMLGINRGTLRKKLKQHGIE